MKRVNAGPVRVALVLGGLLGLATPRAFGAAAIDAPHFEETSGLGVDVALRYRLRSSDRPGGEDDTGPYLASGSVDISAGASRMESVFSLASLGALEPNPPQAFPDAHRDCGANEPIAIEKLDRSPYPAVVINTIVIAKGCLPLAHVFLPVDAIRPSYAHITSYTVAHPMKIFRGEGRIVVPHLDATLHVTNVRQIVLPNPPVSDPVGIRDWTIAIVDGTDANGKPVTIAVDRPNPGELPELGETLSLYYSKGADLLSALRLGGAHEEAYQRLHPSPPARAPGASASPAPAAT